MSKLLEYKGYLGSVDVDVEGAFVFGRLMFIRDIVSFKADKISDLKSAFEAAVDDYLATCSELGEEPDVPCKGTFNVRIGPELHQRISLAAIQENVKLNEWVKQACELKLISDEPPKPSTDKQVTTLVEAFLEDEQVIEFGGSGTWQQIDPRVHH